MTGLIGLRCGEVADAVFPSNFDRTQRDKLALALVELAHALVAQGTEAGTAETVGLGPKDDGPVPQGCAPTSPDPTPSKLGG